MNAPRGVRGSGPNGNGRNPDSRLGGSSVDSDERVFVDGHVHIYPEVPLAAVFAAVRARSVPGDGASARSRTVLALADPEGVDGFARLAALGGDRAAELSGGSGVLAGGGTVGRRTAIAGWAPVGIDERWVQFQHDTGSRVLFLRGQQLVTDEGLEVLAFGARGAVTQGLPLTRTLDDIRARGGWATIAWGVGKWLGRRGKLVTQAIRAEASSGTVALGDNAGRPGLWARVPQFDTAAELGMRILQGSDPLRVPGDEARIASYGFEIEAPVDLGDAAATGASLVRALETMVADSTAPLRRSGRRVGIVTFARNQLRLRLASRPVTE